jgi:sodium transport system permease protein
MKNNIKAILKKECYRLFSDRRLVFSGIILQGLIIFILYNLMGTVMQDYVMVADDYRYRIAAVNMPDSVRGIMAGAGDLPFDISNVAEGEIDTAKERIVAKEIDLLVQFPAGFDAAVAAYDVASGTAAPQIAVYSDGATIESMQADAMVKGVLSQYERSLAKKFDINADPNETYDLNTGSDFATQLVMSMMPMLLIMMIFQGCMVVAPESIAGEKERGTLGTMLATPARRRDMALGKVLTLTVFAVLGSMATFIGLMLSLPKMVQVEDDSLTVAMYSPLDYLMILVVTISTVLVFVALLSVLSAYAKSVKEANTYASPFMMISIVLGLSSMFTGGALAGVQYYFIPVFNSAQCLSAIFGMDYSLVNILVTLCANVTLALVFVGLLAAMFGSERIVFDK